MEHGDSGKIKFKEHYMLIWDLILTCWIYLGRVHLCLKNKYLCLSDNDGNELVAIANCSSTALWELGRWHRSLTFTITTVLWIVTINTHSNLSPSVTTIHKLQYMTFQILFYIDAHSSLYITLYSNWLLNITVAW